MDSLFDSLMDSLFDSLMDSLMDSLFDSLMDSLFDSPMESLIDWMRCREALLRARDASSPREAWHREVGPGRPDGGGGLPLCPPRHRPRDGHVAPRDGHQRQIPPRNQDRRGT